MAFISPNHRAYRYLVLFLICVLTFGGYYSYDLPGSLSYAYTDPSILNLSAFQYNLLYSVYSWPNTILPFFGGYISDRWLGIRASTILFAVLVACGQTLVSFGITAKSFVLIIIGRTVFGLGGESVSVAQSAITARWFKGAEVATAFGIALSFSRIGSAANFDISPSVAGNVCTNSVIDLYPDSNCHGQVTTARWNNHIGDCVTYPYQAAPSAYATAFNCNATFVEFSIFSDSSCAGNNTKNVSFVLDKCLPFPGGSSFYKASGDQSLSYSGFVLANWIGAIACGVSVGAALLVAAMDKNGESYLKEIGTLEDKEPEVVKFKDIAEFPASLWCLFFICVAFYISIFVFIQNGSLFLSSKYGVSNVYSAFLTSIPYTISAIMSPFLGFAVDKTGRWMSWVAASCLCMACTHALFAFTSSVPPIVLMCCIGVSYSVCAAALWPSVSLIVKPHLLGSAYGLMTALQNLGLSVAPLGVSLLIPDHPQQLSPSDASIAFQPLELLFVGCAGLALLLTLFTIVYDTKKGGLLNASSKVVAERQLRDKEAADLESSVEHSMQDGKSTRLSVASSHHSEDHMSAGDAFASALAEAPESGSMQQPLLARAKSVRDTRTMYMHRLGVRAFR